MEIRVNTLLSDKGSYLVRYNKIDAIKYNDDIIFQERYKHGSCSNYPFTPVSRAAMMGGDWILIGDEFFNKNQVDGRKYNTDFEMYNPNDERKILSDFLRMAKQIMDEIPNFSLESPYLAEDYKQIASQKEWARFEKSSSRTIVAFMEKYGLFDLSKQHVQWRMKQNPIKIGNWNYVRVPQSGQEEPDTLIDILNYIITEWHGVFALAEELDDDSDKGVSVSDIGMAAYFDRDFNDGIRWEFNSLAKYLKIKFILLHFFERKKIIFCPVCRTPFFKENNKGCCSDSCAAALRLRRLRAKREGEAKEIILKKYSHLSVEQIMENKAVALEIKKLGSNVPFNKKRVSEWLKEKEGSNGRE